MSRFFQAGSDSETESESEDEVLPQRPAIPARYVLLVEYGRVYLLSFPCLKKHQTFNFNFKHNFEIFFILILI